MMQDPGSFRDPANLVFTLDGDVYRAIFAPGAADYVSAKTGGVYTKLSEAGILLAHEEVSPPPSAPEGTLHCLRYKALPMISYPGNGLFRC